MTNTHSATGYARDFKITRGRGRAVPLFPDLLATADLDDVLGVAEARAAWAAANAEGDEAYRALRAAQVAWDEAHPKSDFAGHDEWLHARDRAQREATAAVTECERAADRALRTYVAAQREAASVGRPSIAEAWLAADAEAREAMNVLDAALLRRERLLPYLVEPQPHASPETGHFMFDPNLGQYRDPLATHQRESIARVVRVAPRALVAEVAAGREVGAP